MNVLLVEDDDQIASFIEKGLRAEGYVTELAASVREALAYVHAQVQEDIDLVLLDLGLPDGAGEEVLVRLRERRSSLPVIVLTARGEVADKVRGLELGANDYITKPFAFEELLARIRVALGRQRSPPPRSSWWATSGSTC